MDKKLNRETNQNKLVFGFLKGISGLGQNSTAIEQYNKALPLVTHKQLWLGLVGLISLSGITCLLFGSQSFAAMPAQMAPRIAQQPANSDAAKQAFLEAWQLFQQSTAVFEQSTALYQQNTAESRSLRQTIPKFEQAVTLSRQAGDKSSEVLSFVYISYIYSVLGEHQKALEFYNQALLLTRAVVDKGGEATTVGSSQNADTERVRLHLKTFLILGNSLLREPRAESLPEAINAFKAAIPLLRLLGDRTREATTLNNIGRTYSYLDEKSRALEYYNQALSLYQAVGVRGSEATALNNIGAIYSHLGEKRRALEYYNQALTIFQVLGDRNGEADLLNNMCSVYSSLGEYRQALEYCDKAFKVYKAIGNYGGEADSLYSIGKIYSKLGDYKQALQYYGHVFPLIHMGGPSAMAPLLNDVGEAFFALGETSEALKYYEQALAYHQAVGNLSGIQKTLYNFANLKQSQGNLTAALIDIEAAIKIIENLRTKIGSQDLRASYFSTVQNYYEFYIDLLMQLHQQNPKQGYDALALHASERARARSLLELLTEANANIRQGVDLKLLEQERTLQQQLNALERRKYEFSIGQFNEQIDAIKKESQSLLTQLDQLKAQIRTSSPRYADLKYPEPLTLKQIQQQVLDNDTLLLQYSLGTDRSYLWAVSKNGITSYVLPKRSEIEAAAQTFRESLKPNSAANLETGLQLSQMLLTPVANQLGNKRLLVVGDGALQSVPFAALPIPTSPPAPLLQGEGSKNPPFPTREAGALVWRQGGLGHTPLLVQNEIITLPSASTVAIQRRQLQNRPPVAKKLAVIADPIFALKDPRFSTTPQPTPETTANYALTRATRNLGLGDSAKVLDRLEYAGIEAKKILALVPEAQRLQALDFNASREIVTNPNLAQYQIIHFATHGLLDTTNPELSGVVLSLYDQKGNPEDGFLRLHDIFNLNLPVELVVLSACQTGLGKEVKGEGLVGLTRGFMYAGARRVVMSLWSVDDLATSEVMAKFYQKMLNEGQNPVSALRAAQLEMWKSQQWQSPYYWAAFTVQGDWK